MSKPFAVMALKVLRDAALIFTLCGSAYWLGTILGAL